MINPCKECEKRTPKCHGSCADYAYWKRQHEEKNAQIRQARKEKNQWFKPALYKITDKRHR